MEEIEYRHPDISDVEVMTDINNISNRELPHHREGTAEDLRRWTFEEDDYDPKGYLLAFVDREPVAYGGSMVQTARQESGIKDAYIGISIVPEHRGKGIEQHMMKHALAYLKKRGVEHAKTGAFHTSGWKHDLATEFGMRDVRHFYSMIYDQNAPPPDAPLPEEMIFDHEMFQETDDEVIGQFIEALNDSFADHYSFSPEPVEKFIKFRDNRREPTRITFAKEGEDIAGILLIEESSRYNEENGTKVGWANILGVRSQYRKRGIGRALLSDGMKWILDQGMDTIYLGVDAENPKALDLYKSLGFRVDEESITYLLDM